MNKRRWFRVAGWAAVAAVVWWGGATLIAWRAERARIDFPKIDRRPVPREGRVRARAKLSSFVPRPAGQAPGVPDVRHTDVSALDLRARLEDLRHTSFDQRTRWPEVAKMPEEFDPAKVLEEGRNPGPGIRALHAAGITGRGVGVAIIDQVLLTEHAEFGERLRLYEETNEVCWPMSTPQMHGAAVASLAVGRTIGVAPEADLYFIATWDGVGLVRRLWHEFTAKAGAPWPHDFRVLARAVRRVLAINRQLPPGRKIRVLAMAIGWTPDYRGYNEIKAAAAEARAAGLLVVCSSIEEVHGFKFHGLGRDPLAPAESFASYRPGLFWEAGFWPRDLPMDRLLVPMDSRTLADYTNPTGYSFHREGGWSWAIPHIAGAYALAVQVRPALTPDGFWQLALRTGRTIPVTRDGVTKPLGPILDLPAVIAALQRGN